MRNQAWLQLRWRPLGVVLACALLGGCAPDLEAVAVSGCVSTASNVDRDRDGFTAEGGDCDDCSSAVNPGALDAPNNQLDEDCSGTADDDDCADYAGIPSDAVDQSDFGAYAIELCKHAQGESWGLLSAKYVSADGSPPQGSGFKETVNRGVNSAFGPNVAPRQGDLMLALSTGAARDRDMPDFFEPFRDSDELTRSDFPPGFPARAPACKDETLDLGPAKAAGALNPSGVELEIRTPSNMNTLVFDFNFYTSDYPLWICEPQNDAFVALLEPAAAGSFHGNISFDADGNHISVNNRLLRVCEPRASNILGDEFFRCPLGTSELAGTGYEASEESGPHAATGWLTTRTPVPSGEVIRLRFAIWDAMLYTRHSLVLIDNVRWETTKGLAGPVTVPAEP